jgi:uncharacterized protein (DUF2267 family)
MEQTIEKIKPKTYELLYDLTKALGFPGDLAKAKIALESVLHSFAAQLDVEKGIEVITSLPVHLKDIFSKGWKPFQDVQSEGFIGAVKTRSAEFLRLSEEQIIVIVKKVFTVLEKYIPAEKMAKIRSCMNKELRKIVQL